MDGRLRLDKERFILTLAFALQPRIIGHRFLFVGTTLHFAYTSFLVVGQT
jgi:hypothetical protein